MLLNSHLIPLWFVNKHEVINHLIEHEQPTLDSPTTTHHFDITPQHRKTSIWVDNELEATNSATHRSSVTTYNAATSCHNLPNYHGNKHISFTQQTCEKTKKSAATRTAKWKTLSADIASLQLAYLNKKPSAEKQNFENATYSCIAECATKGKLTLSALITPSLDHILTCDTVFEHICLHLI